MANVPFSEDVPKIYVPSLSVPHLSTPHLQAPQLATPGKSTYVKPERRHVKDLGDLLLGPPIKGTKQLRHTLKDAGYYRYLNVPVLNKLVGFSVMSKERFLDPISEGEWGVAFVNSLETLGGSLDIVANPVKALLPWAGGGSSTDLLKSMGWIEDEYRETYQWDTGNWLVDLLGEIISDPINWFTFGSGAAMKGSAGAIDDVAKAVIKEFPEEAVSNKTIINLVDDFARHVGDDGSRVLEDYITKQTNQLDDLYKQLNKVDLPNSQRRTLIKQTTALQDEVDELRYLMGTFTPEQRVAFMARRGLNVNPATAAIDNNYYKNLSFQQREKLIQNLINARQSKGYRAYNFWRTVNQAAKGVDELVTKAALYSTLPFGLSKVVYDLGAKPLFKAIWNKAVYALEQADLFNKADVSVNEIRRIKTTLLRETNAAFEEPLENWEVFFKAHNYSVENARKLWLSIFRNSMDSKVDLQKINAQFLEEIMKQVPDLRYATNASEEIIGVLSKDVERVVNNLNIQDLQEYCAITGVLDTYIDSQAIGVVRDRMTKDIKTFWNTKHAMQPIDEATRFSELEPMAVLQYIDEALLKDYGGVSNLSNMLSTLSQTNQKEYQSYLALLNYMGITLDNHKIVGNMLNMLKTLDVNSKEYKTLYKELKDILIQSKTGELLVLDAIEKDNSVYTEQVVNILKQKTENIGDISNQIIDSEITDWRFTGEMSEQNTTGPIITDTNTDFDINVKGLQKTTNKLITDLDAPLETLQHVDADLQSLGSPFSKNIDEYLGSAKKLDTCLKQIMPDTNELYTAYGEFIQQTNFMLNYLDDIEKITDGVKLDKTTKKYLNQLKKDLNKIIDTGVLDLKTSDIKTICQAAMEEGSDVMLAKMSQENMLGHIGDVLNTDLKQSMLWQDLSDPYSQLRKNLMYTCDLLQSDPEALRYITNIKEILSTIDNINLFNKLYVTSFCSYVDLPEQVTNYIRGEFFNRLYAASNLKQPEFLSKIDSITKTFIDNIEHQPDITKMLVEAYPDVQIRNAVIQNIEDIFQYKLRTYIEGLNLIKKTNKLDTISFFKSFNNSNLTERMDMIGFESGAVLEKLLKEHPELLNNSQILLDNVRVATFISNDVRIDLNVNLRNIIAEATRKTGTTGDLFIQNLTEILYEECDKVASDVLKKAFKKIQSYNSVLQKRGKLLGNINGRNVYDALGYMLKTEVNQMIRDTSVYTNMYSFSTAGGVAFKTIVTHEDLATHTLAPQYFRKSMAKEDYELFLATWQDAKDYIKNAVFTPATSEIILIKNNLIDVYTRINTDINFSGAVIPQNIRVYFNNLTEEDLLIWDYITRKSSYNSELAATYAELKQHQRLGITINPNTKYTNNPLAVVSEYQNLNCMCTSPEQLTNILEETNLEHMEIQVNCIQQDYQKHIKDLDTLSVYHDVIVDSYDKDARAVGKLNKLNPLRQDKRLIKDVIDIDSLDTNTKLQLSYFFETENFGDIAINDPKVFKLLKTELCWEQYENVKHLNAKQLRTYIDKNCSGELFIVNPEYDLNYDWTNAYSLAELQDAGLKVWRNPENPSQFIIRRTDSNITNTSYSFTLHDSVFNKQRNTCTSVIKQTQDYFDNEGMDLPYELYTGDLVSEDAVTTLKQSAKYQEAFGDLEEQKLYSNLDETGHNKFFANKTPRPNAMFIGDPECYNVFMTSVSEPYKSTDSVFIPKSNSLVNSITTGVVQATKTVNNRTKLLSLVANDDYYIGNKMFKPIFERASDEEIEQFFKENNFVACVAKQDRKGNNKIYRVYVHNQRTFKQALENKVLVLPYELYRVAVLGINKNKVNSKLLNIYTKYIAGTYKSIWLSTPGFIMRNTIDSMFYKNMASTDGLAGLIDVMKYNYKAAKIIDWYDEIYQRAIDLRIASGGYATPNIKYVRKVLKEMSTEDKKMFYLMLAFEKSGGSAGLTDTVEQAIIRYNRAMLKGVDNVDDSIIDLLYKNSPLGWLNGINDRVERTARLGLLLNLMDNGMSRHNAFKRVIDTHFDYELTEAELGFLGQIFWFITFPIKNSLYYLNEGLTRNPDLLKAQMDAMEQSWNSGDVTWDDVRHSDFLMYNAMTGNIRFKFNGKNIVLKTGSSVLDFFQVLVNPVDAAKERLNPFLSVLLGFEEPSQLNPLSSVSNRIDQIRNGRSLIPSVYTTLYDRKYKKKHYIERKPYVFNSKWRFKPRKTYIKKPSLSRYTSYKFMTNRYYFNKGKNLNFWLNQTNSIQPHWYMNSYRYRKARNKYSIKPITSLSR